MKISYDWRGLPVEFLLKPTGSSGDTLYGIAMMYDGAGRRVSKTSMRKAGDEWDTLKVTHYTDIGTEVRENLAASEPETQVVVNMPQGLGRYGIESASNPATGAMAFEWYLKNHLGSTMAVYGTTGTASSPELKHAYDYRSFGEQIDLTKRNDKVTENFTGKEKDDETELNYFGARYLDPMLGIWTSVDPARQFVSPYLYAGNGYNPVISIDPDGNDAMVVVTAVSKPATGYSNRNSYSYTAYRTDVYLNTEKWKAGESYKDHTPNKSYWVGRDAWKRNDYNKAVISGSGSLSNSRGDIGKKKGYLAATNGGEVAGFTGEGPNGVTHWDGLSFHKGYPKNSDACITFNPNSSDFDDFKADLKDDLDAENPISVEFETFTPQDKP